MKQKQNNNNNNARCVSTDSQVGDSTSDALPLVTPLLGPHSFLKSKNLKLFYPAAWVAILVDA